MRRTPAATLGAAIVVTALGLSACSSDGKPAPVPRPRATQDTTEVTDTTTVAPLPAPDMLANVIYRLADTSIPADQKLGLVQYATPDDQAGLENFGQALRDGGFSELTVQATDLHWSGASNNVIANVTVTAILAVIGIVVLGEHLTPARGLGLALALAGAALVARG